MLRLHHPLRRPLAPLAVPALGLVLALLSPGPARAAGGGPGYAKASSQLDAEKKPGLYHALNVLDGRGATVWCEGVEGEGVGESLTIGFRDGVVFDEVRITSGDVRDEATFKAHGRVRELTIRTSDAVHSFVLVESREAQVFKLARPVEADRVTLEIAAAVKGEGEDDATCLADVVFVYKGKPLNGPWLADKLKPQRGRSKLMGTWYAGAQGARDRFLDFRFDGTFQYRYKPFDPEVKSVKLEGEYALEGTRLRLKVAGKGWVVQKDGAPRPAEGAGDGAQEIVIDARPLKDTLAGTWSDRP